ncbi:MAG: hypothetical protein HFJ28_04255 [Clostridia bacterium]|nr:hypothetical protein [Clostridia bacterium]
MKSKRLDIFKEYWLNFVCILLSVPILFLLYFFVRTPDLQEFILIGFATRSFGDSLCKLYQRGILPKRPAVIYEKAFFILGVLILLFGMLFHPCIPNFFLLAYYCGELYQALKAN